MKNDNSLLVLIFIAICVGILAMYGFILYEVNEIKDYLKIHEGIEIGEEFRYLKDFSDRNVDIFIWYSTLLFAVVAVFVGLIFRYEFNREMKVINSKFTSFTEKQIKRNNNHESEFNFLKNDNYVLMADSWNQLSYVQSQNNEYGYAVYLGLISLKNMFLASNAGHTGLHKDILDLISRLGSYLNNPLYKSHSAALSIDDLSIIINNSPIDTKEKTLNLVSKYREA